MPSLVKAKGTCWSCTAAVNKKNGTAKWARDSLTGRLVKTKKRHGRKVINPAYIKSVIQEFDIVERFEVNNKIRVKGLCKDCKKPVSTYIAKDKPQASLEHQTPISI